MFVIKRNAVQEISSFEDFSESSCQNRQLFQATRQRSILGFLTKSAANEKQTCSQDSDFALDQELKLGFFTAPVRRLIRIDSISMFFVKNRGDLPHMYHHDCARITRVTGSQVAHVNY